VRLLGTVAERWQRKDVALGLLAGTLLDQLLPDPRRAHPVALFGQAATSLERLMWSDERRRGVAFAAVCVGVPITAAGIVDARVGRARPVAVALVTWAVLGSRSLRAEARSVQARLRVDDLPAARERLTHLVGRDPSQLGADEIARACVESVAENTSDAVVAPLFWGALAGVPGLIGYRAVNTLDAMVGHRSSRYDKFGWASARLDDVANVVPARLTAALVALVCGAGGRRAWRVARRDGLSHPSPNSGLCEAAFAGALGVRLGGRNVYGGRVEERPAIGDGRPVSVDDVDRAVRLCASATAAAAVVCSVLAYAVRARP